MSFDDRTLREGDSPKARTLAIEPRAKCISVYWRGRREGYVVTVNNITKGTGRSAWDAWRDAEGRIEDEKRIASS